MLGGFGLVWFGIVCFGMLWGSDLCLESLSVTGSQSMGRLVDCSRPSVTSRQRRESHGRAVITHL